MKLDSVIPQAEPSLTEKEFLQMENQFLQDELEFQELCHSLELIETIKDCIRKEGGVSSSLEIMFGENWSDKSVALEDLEKAEEGLLDFFRKGVNIAAQTARDAMVDRMVQTTREKIEKIKTADLTKVKYPFDIPDHLSGNKVSALRGERFGFLRDNLQWAKTTGDIKSALTKRKNNYYYDVKDPYRQKKTIKSPNDLEHELAILKFDLRDFKDGSYRKFYVQDPLDAVLKITKSDKNPLYVMCFRILQAEFRAWVYVSFRCVNSIYSHVFGNKDSEN